MLSWVCKMSEHMELDFLTNILASSASGYSCLSLLGHGFWQEASFSEVGWVFWKERGSNQHQGLGTNTHHIPSHTPECQHFICRILHCQTPALPGILRFQENESRCFPLHKKAGTPGMKGHYSRPSAWALPVFNSIINTPLIYALFPPPQCWSHSGMCNWMLAASILKSILAFLSIALWDPLWDPWGKARIQLSH